MQGVEELAVGCPHWRREMAPKMCCRGSLSHVETSQCTQRAARPSCDSFVEAVNQISQLDQKAYLVRSWFQPGHTFDSAR